MASVRDWRLSAYKPWATLALLAIVVLVCWWYLFRLAAVMEAMPMAGMAGVPGMLVYSDWTPGYALLMLVMWTTMMMAMMLPSAIPMILLYRQVLRKNQSPHLGLATTLFVAGYMLLWTLFSVVATGMQALLEQTALLSPLMRSQNLLFSGLVLVLAGLYQFSPWKQACLHHCRAPVFFLSRHWHPGLAGALRMGLNHGAYCVGCCALLMALLFVGGVMNLWVIALIAVVVLLEKLIPGGEGLARGLGTVALIVGVVAAGISLLPP